MHVSPTSVLMKANVMCYESEHVPGCFFQTFFDAVGKYRTLYLILLGIRCIRKCTLCIVIRGLQDLMFQHAWDYNKREMYLICLIILGITCLVMHGLQE